jgi:hypothetical protein
MAIALIVLMCAMLYGSTRQLSVTVDEFAHLPAGIAYYQTGDFAAYNQNPPLLRLIAAAPLVMRGVTVPGGTTDRWALGTAFMRSHAQNYQALYEMARVMMLLLTAGAAYLLYALARGALGHRAALVALVLFCFSPTVLAHGALVTTDAGFALAFLATCATGARFLVKPSWTRTLVFGSVLGLAQLTKFSALMLYPISLLALLLFPLASTFCPALRDFGWPRLAVTSRISRALAAAAVSLLWLNAGYLFQGTGEVLAGHVYSDPFFTSLASTSFGFFPLPLPREFVYGLDAQMAESSGHFMVYLFGKASATGWWYYYPVALLLKEPLPLWILLGVVGVDVIRRKRQVTPALLGAAAVASGSLILFMALTNIDIGVRYLLFLLPLLYFIAAHGAAGASTRFRRIMLGGLLTWYCASSLASYPNYLSYFSDVVGGSSNGYRYLADSNLDWGQDLITLKRWMASRGVHAVALSHFGLVDPSVYGIVSEPLSASPRESAVVISVNHLLHIQPWDQSPFIERYRHRKPRERIGQTLWVFDPVPAAQQP